jgi:histidinol phosphatase-like PHP family hydrolase
MNNKVKQMAIESQRINSLRHLRKMANLLNEFNDEYDQINWPIGFEESIDPIAFVMKTTYLRDAIANWTDAINS